MISLITVDWGKHTCSQTNWDTRGFVCKKCKHPYIAVMNAFLWCYINMEQALNFRASTHDQISLRSRLIHVTHHQTTTKRYDRKILLEMNTWKHNKWEITYLRGIYCLQLDDYNVRRYGWTRLWTHLSSIEIAFWKHVSKIPCFENTLLYIYMAAFQIKRFWPHINTHMYTYASSQFRITTW